MKMKIYTLYNERSEMQEGLFMARNDKEAQYIFALNNVKRKQENIYFDENIFKLKCLGIMEMEGKESGILYEHANDFPYTFDEIPDNILPTKHDQESIEKTTLNPESNEAKQIINKARGLE